MIFPPAGMFLFKAIDAEDMRRDLVIRVKLQGVFHQGLRIFPMSDLLPCLKRTKRQDKERDGNGADFSKTPRKKFLPELHYAPHEQHAQADRCSGRRWKVC